MTTEKYYLCYREHQLQLRPGKSYTIGRRNCDVTLPGYLVSRNHARIDWHEDGSPYLIDLESTNGTLVNSRLVTRAKLSAGDKIEIGDSILKLFMVNDNQNLKDSTAHLSDTVVLEARAASLLKEIDDPALANRISDLKSLYNKKNRELNNIAFMDELTGLYNRRHFEQCMAREIDRARRYHRFLHLILVDIDHFKKINDNYGHRKGDQVLACVAKILQKNCRTNDIVCRFGGEEMAIILPETSMMMAQQVAEKIRSTISRLTLPLAGVQVTASFGIAGHSANRRSREEIIEAADKALYKAKALGRNRVCIEVPRHQPA